MMPARPTSLSTENASHQTKLCSTARFKLKPATRRHFLRLGAAALAAGVLPALPNRQLGHLLQNQAHAESPSAPAKKVWRNWSGIQQSEIQSLQTPADEAALSKFLQTSTGELRCVGSGHSFSPLVPTNNHIIALDRMAGVVKVEGEIVTVRAGTRLAQLSRQLDERKLAMRNLPDIDSQSIAGALATATHGTGADLPALHADVVGMRMVTVAGKVIEFDETAPQLLQAARVSLGSFGVFTEFKLKVVPAYNLRRKVWLKPLEELLALAPQLAQQHRHFEFYYLPFTGYAAAITHDVYSGSEVVMPPSQDEDMLRDLRRLRDWFGHMPSLRRWLASKFIDPNMQEEAKNNSFKLLSTPRPTVFNESECHVPRAQGIACVREVIAKLEERNDVFFPLEFRFVKADDAWLSPFYQRDSCSIAVHAAQSEAYTYLVDKIGPIFRKYQGRPHWGKLHAYSAKELAALYPRWQDFQQMRRDFDPQNRLLNPHLRQIFGVGA